MEMTMELYEKMLTKIRLLELLDQGCKQHISYRAKRKPRNSCKMCERLWDSRKKLKDVSVDL